MPLAFSRQPSNFDWHNLLFRAHYSLAVLFLDEDKYYSAHAHVEHVKKYMSSHTYLLESAAELWPRTGIGSGGLRKGDPKTCAP